MKIKAILTNFDFLGYKQAFNVGQKSSFQTLCGSLVSFSLVTLLVMFGFSLFKKVLYHENPNIVVTTYFDEDIPVININNSIIAMTFSLRNPDYSYYIDESIYTVRAFAITKIIIDKNGTIQNKEEELSLIKCNEINQFLLIPNFFNSLDLENLYCLNNNQTISLEGEYGKNTWKFIQLRFQKCINTTFNNNTCKSNEIIENKLNGGYLGLFMSQKSVIPNNYKHPFKIVGKNIFTSITSNFLSDVFLFFKTIQINTDVGLFMHSVKTKMDICYSYHQAITEKRIEDTFLSLSIQMSSERIVYERSYVKLQEVAGEIGGVLKVCLFGGELLVYFFRLMLYQSYITSFFYEKIPIINNKSYRASLRNIQPFLQANSLTSNFVLGKSELSVSARFNQRKSYLGDNLIMERNENHFKTNIQETNNFNTVITNNFIKNGNINSQNFTNSNPLVRFNFTLSKNRLNTINENNYNYNNKQLPSFSLTSDATKQHFRKSISSFSKQVNLTAKDYHKNKLIRTSFCQRMPCNDDLIKSTNEIHLWMLLGPCICKKKIRANIYELNNKFKHIYFLFDAIHYLKNQNDLLLLKRFTITDSYYMNYFKTYNFELPALEDVSLFHISMHKKRRMKDFQKKVADTHSVLRSGNNSNVNLSEQKIQTSGCLDS